MKLEYKHKYSIDSVATLYSFISVCIETRTEIGAHEDENLYFKRKWKMGSCRGPSKEYTRNANYTSNTTYVERCCLAPGMHILTCLNEIGPYGWGNGYIEILGQRYCDDFVGFRAMRKVSLLGKMLKLNIIIQLRLNL